MQQQTSNKSLSVREQSNEDSFINRRGETEDPSQIMQIQRNMRSMSKAHDIQ